jgi:biopolymer transport protein ExbB/TolQ
MFFIIDVISQAIKLAKRAKAARRKFVENNQLMQDCRALAKERSIPLFRIHLDDLDKLSHDDMERLYRFMLVTDSARAIESYCCFLVDKAN